MGGLEDPEVVLEGGNHVRQVHRIRGQRVPHRVQVLLVNLAALPQNVPTQHSAAHSRALAHGKARSSAQSPASFALPTLLGRKAGEYARRRPGRQPPLASRPAITLTSRPVGEEGSTPPHPPPWAPGHAAPAPEVAHVATVQEGQVGLADEHILGGRAAQVKGRAQGHVGPCRDAMACCYVLAGRLDSSMLRQEGSMWPL